MDIILVKNNLCQVGSRFFPCAIGKGGLTNNKIEGDGATPTGTFPLRMIFYRPDRLNSPTTSLKAIPISPEMGWCDDCNDPYYNQLITLPYPARHEQLWRDDHVYDLIIVVGYNDAPINRGKGSAIFIHVARENYLPTEGCLAFCLEDLKQIVTHLTLGSKILIKNEN